jgi:DNA-binding HxlR family transcriptional regulator
VGRSKLSERGWVEVEQHDLTSQWAMLVLAALMSHPHRFPHLAARIEGISEKMLSQILRTLTRDGVINCIVTPTVSIQVTYELTALGTELTLRLPNLIAWIDDHTGTILEAQAAYDAATPLPPALANRH